MTRRYVMGIDTGATKSHLMLFDTDGIYIDFEQWGPLNHEVLPGSFAQFEEELNLFVTKVTRRQGITIKDISYAVFGIAGVDTKKQHTIIASILTKLGFERFRLVNDAFLGIPAGSRTGTGICAINGTGCTLAGINREGKMLQIGGMGSISSDMGGGSCMSTAAISAVYSELFRKGEISIMTPKFFEYLGIQDKHDYMERLYERRENGTFNSTDISKILFEAASKNDKVAYGIISTVAMNYSGGIACMIEEMQYKKDEEIDIVFAGSVFVKEKNPVLINMIKDKIKKNHGGYSFRFTLLNIPPVAGAIIWALDSLEDSCGITGSFYDKVSGQIKPAH